MNIIEIQLRSEWLCWFFVVFFLVVIVFFHCLTSRSLLWSINWQEQSKIWKYKWIYRPFVVGYCSETEQWLRYGNNKSKFLLMLQKWYIVRRLINRTLPYLHFDMCICHRTCLHMLLSSNKSAETVKDRDRRTDWTIITTTKRTHKALKYIYIIQKIHRQNNNSLTFSAVSEYTVHWKCERFI